MTNLSFLNKKILLRTEGKCTNGKCSKPNNFIVLEVQQSGHSFYCNKCGALYSPHGEMNRLPTHGVNEIQKLLEKECVFLLKTGLDLAYPNGFEYETRRLDRHELAEDEPLLPGFVHVGTEVLWDKSFVFHKKEVPDGKIWVKLIFSTRDEWIIKDVVANFRDFADVELR